MSDPIFFNNRLIVCMGDITQAETEAIVNAANSSLMGGGGVDGAIHRKGGPQILEECKKIRQRLPGGLATGEVVITSAGNLKAKYVIHTVGPIWKGGSADEEIKLKNCYNNSLELAVENDIKSIAFPAISTGVYGYPLEKAAIVSSNAIKNFLAEDQSIERIEVIFFQKHDRDIFLENMIK